MKETATTLGGTMKNYEGLEIEVGDRFANVEGVQEWHAEVVGFKNGDVVVREDVTNECTVFNANEVHRDWDRACWVVA